MQRTKRLPRPHARTLATLILTATLGLTGVTAVSAQDRGSASGTAAAEGAGRTPRAATPARGGDEAPAAPAPSTLVDLNTATETELEALPGIGAAKARAILELREREHGFTRVEDVLRAKGIGRGIFRRIRPYVTVRAGAQATAVRRRATRE